MSLANSNNHYFDVTKDYQFENLAIKDLVDVVFSIDENKALRLLCLIGNRARWLAKNGDTSEKIELAAEIGKLFEPHVQSWVEEQQELAEKFRP